MTSLPRFSVDNPVLVNLFMIAIIVGGVLSGLTIVREMFPESRPNRILITTTYPGATPSEVEKGITLKIEEQIKGIDGVEKLKSSITEGRSVIVAELVSGFRYVDQAVNDVKAAIDTIPPEDFPEEARKTAVSKFDPVWPVISVALFGDFDDRTLKTLGERVRTDMLALPGVTDVVLSGTRKDEISIEVKPNKLVEYGLSFMDVAAVITASNLDLPGGSIRTADMNVSVRTLGEKDRGEDLYNLVVLSDPSGRVVRLQDIATIVDGFEDTDVLGRFNGEPAVNVTAYKTAEQDAIDIAAKVRALVAGKMNQPLERKLSERLLAKFSATDVVQGIYDDARANPYPRGAKVDVHTDLSRFVEGRLDLLTRNGAWGLLLVALSLLLFLHWRVAFWVMMGLVLAVMGSLICMRVLGHTLNLITMFGLIIVLGLLVDDAIIVAEHVYSKVEEGMEPRLAAITGTEAVTWPVVCAILTTIVAFVPLMFIEGQIGDWIATLPVIVCIALSVSLIEALTILPAHLAHNLKPIGRNDPKESRESHGRLWRFASQLRQTQERFVTGYLRAKYERLLRVTAAYRYVTMAALTGLLLATLGLVAGKHVPFVFLQKVDSETIVADLRMEAGTPTGATLGAAVVVEAAAMSLAEMSTVYTLVGVSVSDDGLIAPPQSHIAQLFLELTASELRERSSDDILLDLRRLTTDIPGVERLKYSSLQGGPGGLPIHLDISGDSTEDLNAVARGIKDKLRQYEGVFDVVDDFDAGRREVQIELFDSARALGLTTKSLATQVRSAFYGFEARKVQRGREDVRIMVRYPPEYRRRIYDVQSMRIATPDGTLVPFREVARMVEGTGFGSISRINQRRTVSVTADVDTDVTQPDSVMAELAASFPELRRRYPGLTLEFGGQKLETAKSFGSLRYSFFIAIMLIYVILAALFKSYVQPAIVLSVVPFGLIGAVVGHLVMGYPLTIVSMIGVVALTGIVVNDSMILVTFINRRIADGSTAFEAVVEGGKSRLRPILLTSATTVLGVAPLLLEQSFQAKVLIPMAISISAGLMFATVLTLVAIPALYLIVLDLKSVSGRARQWMGLVQPGVRSTT